MNDTIQKLRSWGYDHCPIVSKGARDQLAALKAEEWDALAPTDLLGQELIHAYQVAQRPTFDPIVRKHHKRAASCDGLLRSQEQDPATFELIHEMARCSVSDFGPEAGPDIMEAGSGSWPSNCDRPGINTVRLWIDSSGADAAQKNMLAEVMDKVKSACADCGKLILDAASAAEAQTVMSFTTLGGNTIGLAIVGSHLSCGTHIWLKIDRGWDRSIDALSSVIAHELFHNDGLGHVSGDRVMNPIYTPVPFRPTFRDCLIFPTLVRWFGGEPVSDGPQPGPTPPGPQPPAPTPGDPFLRLRIDDPLTGTKYVLKPAPDLG